MACKNHGDKEAVYQCNSCNGCFCKSCIEERKIGDFSALICRDCGGKCDELLEDGRVKNKVERKAQVTEVASFWVELFRSFLYPLKSGARSFLFTGAIFFGLFFRFSRMAGIFGLPLIIILCSYLLIYIFQIIVTSAYGDDEPPGWPGMSQWIDMVFGPLLFILIATVLCYAPSVAYVYYTHNFDFVFWLLVLGGMFVHPMFLLLIAMTEKIAALNPLLVVVSIFKVPVEYFVAAVMFILLVGIRYISRGAFSGIPFVGFIVQELLMFYCLMVEMRILGVFYRSNEAHFSDEDPEAVESV